MKKSMICCFLLCLGLLITAGASTSHAVSLILDDSNYMGFVNPGTPADPSQEVEYINELRTRAADANWTFDSREYDRSSNTFAFPVAVEADSFKDDTSNVNPSQDFGVMSFQYILGKYGTKSHIWYFAGGISDIEMIANTNDGGLSHISAYNKVSGTANIVPEPATVALLGIGLVGLAGAEVRRRRKKAVDNS